MEFYGSNPAVAYRYILTVKVGFFLFINGVLQGESFLAGYFYIPDILIIFYSDFWGDYKADWRSDRKFPCNIQFVVRKENVVGNYHSDQQKNSEMLSKADRPHNEVIIWNSTRINKPVRIYWHAPGHLVSTLVARRP